MKIRQKAALALAVIALTASNFVAAQTTLLNVSYDVSREFYKDVNAAFIASYKKSTGKQTVTYSELVEVVLCHGWIDGQTKGINAECFAQRFSLGLAEAFSIHDGAYNEPLHSNREQADQRS